MKKVKMFLMSVLVMATVLAPSFATGQQEASGEDSVNLVYWSMWNGREIRKTLQPALDAGTTQVLPAER